MLFTFPKHKVGSRVWFLDEEDRQVFGKIDMITIAIKADSASIYYGIEDKNGMHFTVESESVLENRLIVDHPKFNVNDEVAYEFMGPKGQTLLGKGTITGIQVNFDIEDGQVINYFMDDDTQYQVLEYEIIGMADSVYNEAMVD